MGTPKIASAKIPIGKMRSRKRDTGEGAGGDESNERGTVGHASFHGGAKKDQFGARLPALERTWYERRPR
jgi:hypothetical protein